MGLISFLCWSVLATAGEAPTILNIEVVGIKQIQGYIVVAVYDSPDTFLSNDVVASEGWTVVSDTLNASIQLEAGKYAISIFHDLNSDGEFNTNILGIPKEPFGFSNNAKGNFGPPDFEKAAFELTQDNQKLNIKLTKI